MKYTTASLLLAAALALGGQTVFAGESELVAGVLASDVVPRPVEYYALLPPDYENAKQPLPLVLNLHGGGGDREKLKGQQPMFDQLWSEGSIPPMLVVMPSVTRASFYVDRRDGSELWETFLVKEFLPYLRGKYNVTRDRRSTMLTGVSMGGMGSLRLAFKYPQIFGAVAAQEAGIEPVLQWSEMRPKHRFWRSDLRMEKAYGSPIDEEHYAANNPAMIATRNADKLRESGLKIYLEAGDEDMYWLYEGTQFLHQILWDNKIRHEYHLVYGADHVGNSLGPRMREAIEFLGRMITEPAPDPFLKAASQRIDALKANLLEADHYEVDKHLIKRQQ